MPNKKYCVLFVSIFTILFLAQISIVLADEYIGIDNPSSVYFGDENDDIREYDLDDIDDAGIDINDLITDPLDFYDDLEREEVLFDEVAGEDYVNIDLSLFEWFEDDNRVIIWFQYMNEKEQIDETEDVGVVLYSEDAEIDDLFILADLDSGDYYINSTHVGDFTFPDRETTEGIENPMIEMKFTDYDDLFDETEDTPEYLDQTIIFAYTINQDDNTLIIDFMTNQSEAPNLMPVFLILGILAVVIILYFLLRSPKSKRPY